MALRKIVFTSALILVSCSAAADYPEKYSTLVESAKSNIRAQLKDPYSAEFEDIFIGKSNNNSPVVCGKVNAKNSYGGYVGRKRFYFTEGSDKPISEIEEKSGAFSIIYEALCTKVITN